MRGIGYTLSRLPSARVCFAGAAIIAGTFASTAHGQSFGSGNGTGTPAADNAIADEAAFALPRAPHDRATGTVFPRPLRPSDAAVAQRIFSLQHRGDMANAARAANDLEDPLLLGTISADRYLSRYHKSTVSELSDWLMQYRDLPDAGAIYSLLLTKLPKGDAPPDPPANAALTRSGAAETVPEDIDPPRDNPARNPQFDRAVIDRAEQGNAASALRMIASARRIDAVYAARLRAEVAQESFIRNEDAEALRIVQASLKSTNPDDQSALAYYIGGLAAWRLDQIDTAKTMFEQGAEAHSGSSHLHAASAFWASRVSGRLNDSAGTLRWLRAAAMERLTLHGFLARRILRMDTGILPSGQLLSEADVLAVAATPAGLRAFALLQIGQPERAEAELRTLWPRASASSAFGQSLLMVASATGLTDYAAQMAGLLQTRDGRPHEELRFAVPKLRPAGGFRIDPPLVYALTRMESNFHPEAISSVGARGLMQIMPSTAQYITGNADMNPDRLHEPATNLEIGQRYVSYLARLDGIDNDLMRVLASYNCGPGNYLRWGPDVHDGGDPLLFIEAIPIAETRAFVPHVLLYSWIYAARLHRQAPSLDSLAAGEFPRFTPPRQERTLELLASDVR
jgi:soluble lytic murein transglycosylase-like protein